MKKVHGMLCEITSITMNEREWYPCSSGEGGSCITKEEERPLTRQEKALGWSRRPFNAYVADNMCLSCRVYWHVSVASNDAHRLECLSDAGHKPPKALVTQG